MAAAARDEIVVPSRSLRDPGPYRRSAPWFALLVVLIVPAFWPSYFFPEKVERDWHVHAHGLALFSWIALLVVQPWLIQRGRHAAHRSLGKTSYVLAPWIVLSSILLVGYRLRESITPDKVYFLWVQVATLTYFILAYAQAIRHRHEPALHARYMVCTAFALFDPIMARVIYNVAGIDYPAMQAITWLMIDTILLVLWRYDATRNTGIRVFPAMLAVFAVLQVPTFFLYQTPGWMAFVEWYAALPLP